MTDATGVAGLRDHLVASRLAGQVQTSPRGTLRNCGKLVAGKPSYTFGLSDWRTASFDDAVAAVRALCGGDPAAAPDPGGDGWIDPDATLRAIAGHRDRLAAFAAAGGRVLLATGHPTGLLPHYGAVARALQGAGCKLLAPLDDETLFYLPAGPRRLRFLDGVACVTDGGALRHSHRARYMEAMLDALGGGPGDVDLVVGDHGMAGAAIERGIPTLSIADVNDPALPLAQARGRTDAVLPIDDNLPPRVFVPVTWAILDWS
ncbi:MAG TPA: phosphatase [Egibacteraceae bacterium]|nr:phosphatase [Egibacteraceae bacterium]